MKKMNDEKPNILKTCKNLSFEILKEMRRLLFDEYTEIQENIMLIKWELSQIENRLSRNKQTDIQAIQELLQRDAHRKSQLENKLNRYIEKQNKIQGLLDTFDELDRDILKLKYIDGYTLEEISHKLGYSNSHIRKKHAELKRMFKYMERLR